MNYTELIYSYFDGELSPILEDKLFAEMSINQDLRNEFAKQIKINTFTMQELNTLQVPSEVTSKLFANLGFSIPASSALKPNSTFDFYRLKNSKYKLILFTSMLILSIAGVWLYNFSIDNNQKENYQINNNKHRNVFSATSNSNIKAFPIGASSVLEKQITNKSNSEINNSQLNNRLSANISKNNNRNKFYNSNKNIDQLQNINSNKSAYYENTLATNNSEINTINNTNHSNTFTLAKSNINAINNNLKSKFSHSAFNYNLLSQANKVHSNFELVFNTSAISSTNKYPFKDTKSFFSGSSISLLYKINEQHLIGGDFGEDDFYQEFIYDNGDQEALYQQMPNYFWGTVSYKYQPNFLNFSDIARIYAKTSFGGCKAGAIGKFQLGLNIPITPSISGFVGGEFSTLIYNISKDLYNTNKFELLYGISLNL